MVRSAGSSTAFCLRPHPLAQLPLCRLLNKVKRAQRHQNKKYVADPWVERAHSQPVQDVRVVNHVPHVEVEQVQAIASLAHKDQWTHAQRTCQRILSGKPQHKTAEERHEKAIMKQHVWHRSAEGKQREYPRKSEDAKQKPQVPRAWHKLIQFRQQHAEYEAREMGQWRVLQGLQPRAVTPSVGMRNAVGIEDNVKRAGDQTCALPI